VEEAERDAMRQLLLQVDPFFEQLQTHITRRLNVIASSLASQAFRITFQWLRYWPS
jgi:hypothetical protein